MKNKANFWIRYLFPIFLALFLGSLMFMMAQFREPPGFALRGVVWFIGSVFLIWESGWWFSSILDRQFPWQKGTFKRLSIQLLLTNLFGIFLFLGSFLILNWYENEIRGSNNPLGWLHIVVNIAEAFIIVQITNSVQIGYQLLEVWQKVQLEAEDYKKELVITRLEAVQQQIDPQFLNNNFNTLEEMIQESPEKVSAYLKELSDSYSNNQAQLVSTLANVQQELKVTEKELAPAKDNSTSISTKYKSRFLVRSGTRLFLIPVEDIIAFYKDDIVLLFTINGKKYAVDHSLEELNGLLDTKYFFRINRQCIVNARYIGEMKTEGNQLQLTLNIHFPKSLIVSQRNVRTFKRWLNEENS